MLATTDKWSAGQDVPERSILQNFVKYRLVADFDGQEQAGVTPAMPLVEEYEALSSFKEFAAGASMKWLESRGLLLLTSRQTL